MLKIDEVIEERLDESTNEIIPEIKVSLTLEHSLLSISKWESKWHKPFLDDKQKEPEELRDYVRCMCITQNVDESIFEQLPDSVIKKVYDYIQDPYSATTFHDYRKGGKKGPGHEEIITSELIYYWMVAYQIPFSCEKWHLTRLLNLVKICNIKNEDPKKSEMSRREILERNAKLNMERRAKLHSKG